MNTILCEAGKSGARMVVLETQTCNENAISFYRKNVFEIIGFDFYAYTNSDPEQHEVRLEIGKRLKSSGCVKSEMPVEIRIRTEDMRINTSEQEKPVSKRERVGFKLTFSVKAGYYGCRETRKRGEFMMKRIHQILHLIVGSSLGIFIGYGIYSCRDFRVHPELYRLQYAPWYTGIQIGW